MTYEEIALMVEETGLPSAYDHFVEGESPDPPFIVFLLPTTENFIADGVVYQEIVTVRLELYTDKKSPDTERAVEKILDAHGIPWDKDEEWLPDEKLYETYYEFDVYYEPEDEENDEEEPEDSGNNG